MRVIDVFVTLDTSGASFWNKISQGLERMTTWCRPAREVSYSFISTGVRPAHWALESRACV